MATPKILFRSRFYLKPNFGEKGKEGGGDANRKEK